MANEGRVTGVYSNRNDNTDPDGSYSVLTEKDVAKAVEVLRGNLNLSNVDFPEIDNTGDSWAMAMAMALIQTFRVRVTEGGPSALGSAQPITMRMHMPLGRHAYDTTVSADTGLELQAKHMGGKGSQQLLRARYELCKEMIHKNLESVSLWVDIANRATRYTVKDILNIENI